MEDLDTAPRHPIRVVAQRTGLTTATIRAWERRYEAVNPGRSEGGQRLYSDCDVARLKTLRALTEAGRSISSVAGLPPQDASALLAEDAASAAATSRRLTTEDAPDSWTDQAYARLRALDDHGLDRTLRRALATLGARRFLQGVVTDLLGRVGAGWETSEVTMAQEHLGSAVLERILAEIADRSGAGDHEDRLVVATLPGERHALGGRLVAAAAALEGWRVSYLSTDLPPAEIAHAATTLGARAVAISMVAGDQVDAAARDLAALRAELDAEIDILVGGRAAGALDARRLPAGIVLLGDLEDLRTRLLDSR
ncbi:MAG: MerR family transcriptional regulator [Gemmatimonadetes bacterium]|nr:MerR family transcriptional regulator [Gemmatimonadota bacterium]